MKLRNIAFALLVVLLAGCQRTKPIVILYENDVHCAVEVMRVWPVSAMPNCSRRLT